MLMTIYKRAFSVLMKKPLKLWGISLLAIVLSSVLSALCGVAIPVLGLAVSLLISTSMTIIFLKGYRGEEVEVTQLFACFKDWNTIKRVTLGLGWMLLWIFLWSLIPIVGPIFALIRTYEYRLTPYILVYEPEVPITEAIKISAQKTKGYKLQMWLADFVWGLVFGAAVLVLSLLALIPVLGILFALAMIVLYNLTNINITERIREIATIKVLGFHAKETAAYVFKENLLLSAMGMIVGLGGGWLLLKFVMNEIRVDLVWFVPMLQNGSVIAGMVMTMLAACLVDFLLYFKLEKINMAEALKSVE